MKSPPKKAGGIGTAALRKLTSAKRLGSSRREINETFLILLSRQINGIGLFAWPNEAGRLLDQYWETGDPKHLNAFIRHITAMRDYWEGLAR